LKPQYQALCCTTCERYEASQMFDAGFNDPVTIRMKDDFGHTTDRIFIINEKVRRVLQDADVAGYEIKPVASSGWYALRVTVLVECNRSVVTIEGPDCPECGRSRTAFGIFEYLHDLSLPNGVNTFFTTKASWPRASSDRDIFVTEDIVQALKAARIKGGCCTRLLSDEELAKQHEKEKRGVKWKPPGMTVYLSGK